MLFRFIWAVALAAGVSLAGASIEKQCVALRRELAAQAFQRDVLDEHHARLKLEFHRLAAPSRLQRSMPTNDGRP